MAYSQKSLFELAKKILIFSGKKGKISSSSSKKILHELELVRSEISADTSPIGRQIITFINDIISDIKNNREVNLDGVLHDEYIENFLISESFVIQYNSLLTHVEYLYFINTTKQEDIYKKLIEQHKLVEKIISNIQIESITKRLLIIDIFQIAHPKKYYQELYSYFLRNNNLKAAHITKEIITMLQEFHGHIHISALSDIEKENFESTYLQCNIGKNKLAFQSQSVSPGKNNLHYKNILLKHFPL